jgi:hypothetical protein
MVVVLPIAPMMRIAKPGNQRRDRKGVFLP